MSWWLWCYAGSIGIAIWLLLFNENIEPEKDRPLLAAALMVKDEITTVGMTVRSLSEFGVKRLFVFDTGSTDGTQALIRKLALEYNLELRLKEGRFVNFAASRNVLLKFAQFQSEWLLLLDSGEELRVDNSSADMSIEQLLKSTKECSFDMKQQWDETTFFNNRLVRNNGEFYYVFPVHEYIKSANEKCKPQNWDEHKPVLPKVCIFQNRTLTGHSSAARWIKDAQVLQEVVDRDPTEPRGLFYLANTLSQLGNESDAIPFYERRYRVTDRGWWEEREVSLIFMIRCMLKVGRFADAYIWALRLYYDHSRIEGVYDVAVASDESVCVGLVSLACRAETPTRYLFIDYTYYQKHRWDLKKSCFAKFISKNQ